MPLIAATGVEVLQLLHLTDHPEHLQCDECLDFLFAVGLVSAQQTHSCDVKNRSAASVSTRCLWHALQRCYLPTVALAPQSLKHINRLMSVLLIVLLSAVQNPTLDLLEGKLRQLKLHKRHTYTWRELTHVW
jgi:hypothetical protein